MSQTEIRQLSQLITETSAEQLQLPDTGLVIHERLIRLGEFISQLEKGEKSKPSETLIRMIRAVLTSALKSGDLLPSDKSSIQEYFARLSKLDPKSIRRARKRAKEASEWTREERLQHARSNPSNDSIRAVTHDFPEPIPDGYVIGSCVLQPYIDRLNAFKATANRTGDCTAQIRAVFGLSDGEAVDQAALTHVYLACFHEPFSPSVSDLLSAVLSYTNYFAHITLPRVTGLTILEELERRD